MDPISQYICTKSAIEASVIDVLVSVMFASQNGRVWTARVTLEVWKPYCRQNSKYLKHEWTEPDHPILNTADLTKWAQQALDDKEGMLTLSRQDLRCLVRKGVGITNENISVQERIAWMDTLEFLAKGGSTVYIIDP